MLGDVLQVPVSLAGHHAGYVSNRIASWWYDHGGIGVSCGDVKAILRKAAARTIDGLWDAICDALPTFTPQDCASYFTAAGYEPE